MNFICAGDCTFIDLNKIQHKSFHADTGKTFSDSTTERLPCGSVLKTTLEVVDGLIKSHTWAINGRLLKNQPQDVGRNYSSAFKFG